MMIDSYFYKIYGLIVKTNIEMPLLERVAEQELYDLNLEVFFKPIYDNTFNIVEKDSFFLANIHPFAEYYIFKNENKIICNANNFEGFFSTLFNIPFSIYFTLQDEILLHACTLRHKNSVICLAGEKGVGKSTLTHLLNETEELDAFADDTLRISTNGIGYAPHKLIKFTKETVNAFSIENHHNIQNAAGKTYGKIEGEAIGLPVTKIIKLVRNKDDSIRLVKPTKKLHIRDIFISNITGISLFPSYLLKKSLSKDLPKTLDFYFLYTPNNLASLRAAKEDIKELLLQTEGEKVCL